MTAPIGEFLLSCSLNFCNWGHDVKLASPVPRVTLVLHYCWEWPNPLLKGTQNFLIILKHISRSYILYCRSGNFDQWSILLVNFSCSLTSQTCTFHYYCDVIYVHRVSWRVLMSRPNRRRRAALFQWVSVVTSIRTPLQGATALPPREFVCTPLMGVMW